MGSSRMISRRKAIVSMAHICSKCKLPVVHLVTIESESQKTYTFLQERATEIANNTANQAIEDEIQRIAQCRNNHLVLKNKTDKPEMIKPGYFCSSSIYGQTTPCPFCKNVEPWQGENCNETSNNIPSESYPLVFRDSKEAEKWANGKVASIMEDIDKIRDDSDEVERCTSSAVTSWTLIDDLNDQLNAIPEIKVLKDLEVQLKELQNQHKALGVLDIKGRNEFRTQEKNVNKQIEEVKEIKEKKESVIEKQIIPEKISLLRTQAIAFGYDATIRQKQFEKAFAFFFIPNPIPSQYLTPKEILSHPQEEADNSSISESEGSSNEQVAFFCRKCGFKLKPDSVFCTKCGTKVEVD